MPEEEIVDVPEAAAVPANWPTNGASPAEALQAQVARDLANDPLAEVCFRAETARARGNACFGEGDVEGAVAEWTESIRLSGSHARCAESKALALANRSLARLHLICISTSSATHSVPRSRRVPARPGISKSDATATNEGVRVSL